MKKILSLTLASMMIFGTMAFAGEPSYEDMTISELLKEFDMDSEDFFNAMMGGRAYRSNDGDYNRGYNCNRCY